MSQSHGRRFEHELVNGVEEITPPEVWVGALGFSGNSKHGGCDLVVTVSPKLVTHTDAGAYHIEAKKRQGESGKRVIALSGSSGDESGLDELRRLVECTPSWADPILALKFDRRKLIVLDARWLLAEFGEMKYPIPDQVDLHGARLTGSDSISMIKPDLSSWESASAAPSDEVVLAEKLGLPYEVDDGPQ